MKPTVEFVIAHYLEDLSWLRDVPEGIRITIYSKGDVPHDSAEFGMRADGDRITALPNKGREADTYLHHLVFHYSHLAPLTVFLQGRPHDHADAIPTSLEDMGFDEFKDLARHATIDNEVGLPNHTGLPIGKTYERIFRRKAPEFYVFGPGAQFAVTRDLIHRKPLSWWAMLYSTFNELDDAVAAHTLERLWSNIFKEEL